jgi:sugar fermentation stimulation protein A
VTDESLLDEGGLENGAEPFSGPLEPVTFVDRPNRFVVVCARAGGDEVEAHLADPGRLRELLVRGRRMWLRPSDRPDRKTKWTAVLVEAPDGVGLVSVDTTLPNRLVGRALAHRALPELTDWTLERSEAPVDHGRVDFVLARADGARMALEVKSVTLVEEGVARFPDAVTARGARHVRGLAELARQPGWFAALMFVAQRSDVKAVTAAPDIDPEFAAALAEARAAGVAVLARRCRVTLAGVALAAAVPVR